MPELLTKRQKVVLDCIVDYLAHEGKPPSMRELAALIGISSPSTISQHIKSLERKGYLTTTKAKSRAYTLTSATEIGASVGVYCMPISYTIDDFDVKPGDYLVIKKAHAAQTGDVVEVIRERKPRFERFSENENQNIVGCVLGVVRKI